MSGVVGGWIDEWVEPVPAACHCLCGVAHPLTRGVCDPEAAVTVAMLYSPRFGHVPVPVCAPCREAAA